MSIPTKLLPVAWYLKVCMKVCIIDSYKCFYTVRTVHTLRCSPSLVGEQVGEAGGKVLCWCLFFRIYLVCFWELFVSKEAGRMEGGGGGGIHTLDA